MWGRFARPTPSRAWRERRASCVLRIPRALDARTQTGEDERRVVALWISPFVLDSGWPPRISDNLCALKNTPPLLRLSFLSQDLRWTTKDLDCASLGYLLILACCDLHPWSSRERGHKPSALTPCAGVQDPLGLLRLPDGIPAPRRDRARREGANEGWVAPEG